MSKILIVEDDADIVKSLVIRLRHAGHQPVAAADAINAMTMVQTQKPELILLDISLPGGDGFVIAERLQAMSTTCSIPVVFMTASRMPGLRERAASLGALAFLEKPYEFDDLLDAIQLGTGEPIGNRPQRPAGI